MIGTIRLPWQKESLGKVFVSYRRDDAKWAAGRMADSLGRYFGDDRVFRDIEKIDGGADFAGVIHGTLDSADAAIILIGSRWLESADDQGNRRLDEPDDWVAREIIAILEAGIPVYPVLIEDTQMPRAEQLPETLRQLVRYNAVSISDRRWENDVERLARLVALDIPSAIERKLDQLNLTVSLALLLTVLTTLLIMVPNIQARIVGEFTSKPAAQTEPLQHADENGKDQHCSFWDWPFGNGCSDPRQKDIASASSYQPLSLPQSGITFLAIVPCSALLFVFSPLVEKNRRVYFLGAAWAGAIGSLVSFLLLAPISEPFESISMFFGSTLTALFMFAFMNLSGFRPR